VDPIGEIGLEVLKTLALGVFIPLLAPVLRFFDRGRKHAEVKRKLELVKLMAEIDAATGSCTENRKERLAMTANSIASSSPDLVDLFSEAEPNKGSASPFSFLHGLLSLIPLIGFILFVLWASVKHTLDKEDYIFVSICLIITAVLSLALSKYFVCRFVYGIKSQLTSSFIVLGFSLLLSFVILVFFKNGII